MAIVSGMLGTVRGRVGGLTFRASKDGPTVLGVRNPRQVDPAAGRVFQIYTNRALLAYLSRCWGRLQPEQRAFWEYWASTHPAKNKVGGTFLMSGINAFVKLNHTRMRLSAAAVFAPMPPVATPVAVVSSLAIADGATPGSTNITWTHAGTALVGDFNEVAKSGPYVSPGRVRALHWASYTIIEGNKVVYAVTSLAPGAWYWWRVRYISADGQVSPWMGGQWQAKV